MNNTAVIAIAFVTASAVILAIVGWVMNIIALCHMDGGHVGELVVRIVGIFIAPVGAVAGWF